MTIPLSSILGRYDNTIIFNYQHIYQNCRKYRQALCDYRLAKDIS
jgi:hypothetical protein